MHVPNLYDTRMTHAIENIFCTLLINSSIHISAREVFGHIESVKILVILNPTGYMFTSSGSSFHHLRYIL